MHSHMIHQQIALQEKRLLDRLLKEKRGNDLLQVGGPSDGVMVEQARMRRKFYLDSTRHANTAMPFIQAHASCLPIESESIDLVVMLHQLEMARHPMEVVQEMHRVLRPNGQLIMMGFHKWSVWNLCCAHQSYFSLGKIKRCLMALDFKITLEQTACFWPPHNWIETLGHFLFPHAGSIYLFVAQKNIAGMTPLTSNHYAHAVESRFIATR